MGWAPWESPWKSMLKICMMLEQMVMAPTAGSPPKALREELKEMFTRLSVDCMIKGDTPTASTGASTRPSRRK